MSNFTGMDIQAVRDLATQLTNKAGEIDSLRQQLTGKIDGTPWVGADRERFHSDWSSRHSVALTQVADALRDAASTATRNASEQETASNS